MSETIKPGDLRQHLGTVLDRVEAKSDQFVIERRGQPLAALMSYAKFQRLEKAAELEIRSILERDQRKFTAARVRELARSSKRRNVTEPKRQS